MATSKTPKQPPFPHPPLEVGVAQYPTPLVPNYNDKTGGWNILDQGHIILVEKINIEKGSFTPLPLDGSVIYTGRDANKWPSTLYLVAEKPTPDGEFCFRYWANDRSLSSQELWNYGLDYSANNPSYPITSRTYIVPRSQYSTITLGTHDPVFGGTQIISQQKMVELPEDNPLASRYVAVQRVYETIPGPVITGKRLDQRGDLETVNVQTVVAGTSPDSDGLLVTETKVDGVDSVKSTKTTASVASYATLTTKTNKAGLLGDTSTTDDIVAPTTNPDALSTTILESIVEQLTATKARKRTTTSSGPTELDSKEKKAGLLGETTIAQSIVSYGSSPDNLSTSVVSSSVEAIDAYKSKKTTITSSGPTSLTGDEKKAGLLGITETVESIVAAGASPDNLSTTVLQSSVTPIDSAKSKKTTITSSGPTELDGKSIGEFGYITTAESIVDYGSSLPTPSSSTVKLEKSPIDSYKSKLINSSYDQLYTLTGYQYDSDLNLIITNTKEIVDAGSSLTSSDGLISSRDEPLDKWKTIRIQSRISSLPASRTEYKTGSYASPNLLTGFNNSFYTFPDGTINYNVTPVMRAKRSYQTVFKYARTYQYGQPSQPSITLFDPLSINVLYKGFFFSIELNDVLTDSGLSISFSTGTNNATSAKYGSISETYNVPTSTTTATQYVSYVGSYKTISYDIEYWKANIWINTTTSVLIK
jgi:hypothetical protein